MVERPNNLVYRPIDELAKEARLTHKDGSLKQRLQTRLLIGRIVDPHKLARDPEFASLNVHKRLSEFRREGMVIEWYEVPNAHYGLHRVHFMRQENIDAWNKGELIGTVSILKRAVQQDQMTEEQKRCRRAGRLLFSVSQGRKLQARYKDSDAEWTTIGRPYSGIDFDVFEYRLKPEE